MDEKTKTHLNAAPKNLTSEGKIPTESEWMEKIIHVHRNQRRALVAVLRTGKTHLRTKIGITYHL